MRSLSTWAAAGASALNLALHSIQDVAVSRGRERERLEKKRAGMDGMGWNEILAIHHPYRHDNDVGLFTCTYTVLTLLLLLYLLYT